MKRKISLILTIVMLCVAVQGVSYAKPCNHESKTIGDLAIANEQLSTLVAAVKAADLVEALQSKGELTVFAPTNDAFAKLPQGTVETLLKPENKNMLVDILTYHIYPGKLTAKDVVKLNGKTIQMLNGKPAKIEVKGKDVYINDAKVTTTDIMASNGVIHTIDTVITPPAKQ